MVCVHLYRLIHKPTGTERVRPPVVGSWNDLPEVAVDGVDKKSFTMPVPVVAPGVGGAVADRLKLFPVWVVTPDATANRHLIRRGIVGTLDESGGRSTAAAIQPPVGTKPQAVGKVVMIF